jgi:hypothetical protein
MEHIIHNWGKRLSLILGLLVCAMVLFTACSSDDDDDNPGNNAAVVGNWIGYDYDSMYSNVSITFNSDGTGDATIDLVGAFSSYRNATFTYKVKGSTITTTGYMYQVTSHNETDTSEFNNTYEVIGNMLYVKDGNHWYKGRVSSYRKQE